MSIDDMDEDTLNLALKYGKYRYKAGYEQGKKDAVKHGHWEFVEKHFDGFNDFSCSECGHKTDVICVASLPNYCKYCGAKMDGDVND